MSDKEKKKRNVSDEQAVRKDLTRHYDHEFANEPLTETERANNKKTKKRQ
ncbi:small acid-soluble spore protein O [Virgibacillus siamensis]|nr:small acid-soluble spore protein O [Virgibacillus siamensis]